MVAGPRDLENLDGEHRFRGRRFSEARCQCSFQRGRMLEEHELPGKVRRAQDCDPPSPTVKLISPVKLIWTQLFHTPRSFSESQSSLRALVNFWGKFCGSPHFALHFAPPHRSPTSDWLPQGPRLIVPQVGPYKIKYSIY